MARNNDLVGLNSTRHQILAAAGSRSEWAILLELPEPLASTYQPSAVFPAPSAAILEMAVARDSLLTRWLRVNGEPLEVPDAIGVFDELTQPEQHMLQAMAVDTCVPLVYERHLVGWIALVGTKARSTSANTSSDFIGQAPSWAARLYEGKATLWAHERSETVARTNRLSVTGQLAAHIAHEVRNPLASIRSTVQMIRDGDAPIADHNRLHDTVMAEVDRVNLVLQDMLTLGRPRTPNYEECDLRIIAERASHFCFPYVKQAGQSIEVSGSAQVLVFGDAYELRQVLVNLLLNACQASRSGSHVQVAVFEDRDRTDRLAASVRVSDAGAGIPADQLSRVFDPFHTTKVNGGGLGLGICREIIERHGGVIDLASQVGVGTHVTLHLPLASTDGTHLSR